MPPIPVFDSPELLGALEIGAFVSIFLFGTVVMQGHLYYQSCKTDSKWLIAFISLILLLELGHTAATAQSVWWATITISGMVIKPGNGYAISMCILYSAVITSLVKAYYINRVRQLSSKTWVGILGWVVIAIDGGLSLAVSYVSFLDVPREPDNFEVQRKWGWLISASLGTAAASDTLIAAAMVFYLKRFSDLTMNRSAELLNGLLIWTIETGLLTSFASVTVLILFHTMEFNYIWFAVFLPLAKLYSNSVLASLNARPARRQRLGLVQHSSSESPIRFATRSSQNSGSSNSTGIQIPRRWRNSNDSWAIARSSRSSRRSTIASSALPSSRDSSLSSGSSSLRRSTVGSDKAREKEVEKKTFLHIDYSFDVVNALNALDSPPTPMPGDSPTSSATRTAPITPTHRSTSLNQNLSCASSSTAYSSYPRQKINSICEINGKKRTQYVYSGTAPRPRASSRSKHGNVHPYAQPHSLMISPIQEGRF